MPMTQRAEAPACRSRARRDGAALGCALVMLLSPALPARAQAQAAGLSWPEDARHAAPIEYAAAGALAVTAFILALNPPDHHRTSGPWLLDGNVRGGLRLDSADARGSVDTLSDGGLWAVISYPLIDALLAATALEADDRVPAEMAVQTMLVFSSTAFVTYMTKHLIARDRPYGAQCREDPSYARECSDAEPPASFISGHASLTFAAATMSCVHHFELRLYRDPVADAAACAVPLALATAVSLLRVLADQHYATDVLVGAAIGTLSGLGLGLLLHY